MIWIEGLVNSLFSTPTSSFKVYSYTDEVNMYKIDKIEEGLTLVSDCNYPCATCNSLNKSLCTSCVIDQNGFKLQNGICVVNCDEGYFYQSDINTCIPCNPSCAACSAVSKDICTKCIMPTPYLHQDKCLSQCPDGFNENVGNGTCQPCDFDVHHC